MGKIFITDEGNNDYTADVTRAGLLRTVDAADSIYRAPSAAASAGRSIYSAACWLKSVIVGSSPATASVINIYNTSASGNYSGSAGAAAISGTSAANIVARINIPVTSTTAVTLMPRVLPFNVYLASGLVLGLGDDGQDGDLDGVTVVYQL